MVIKKSRKKGVSVDFGGVEAGGGRPCRDGRWKGFPSSCELKETDEGNEYFKFKWKITSGPDKGAIVYDNCSLQPQALWRLKTLLEVWGEEVPDGAMELDPDDLIGEDKEIIIEITNEKYQGKDQPRITGFGGEEDEAEEEEKPAKKPSKKPVAEEEEEEKPAKKTEKLGKTPKIKEGSKVQFTDDDDNVVRGTVTEIDDDTAKVEDKKGEEWEVPVESLELQ